MAEAVNRKVGFSAGVGALSAVIVWALNTFVLQEKTKIPAEIASALTTLLTFITGYFVPEPVDDDVAWIKMKRELEHARSPEQLAKNPQGQRRIKETLAPKAGIPARRALEILRRHPEVEVSQGERYAKLA